MKPFAYLRPATAADAVRALADGGPGTRVLAGGTTVYDLMKLGVEAPAAVVDITRIPGWRRSTRRGGTSWCSGRWRG